MKALFEAQVDTVWSGHVWDTQDSVAFRPVGQQEWAATASFRRLVERHERTVLRFSYALLGDLADAHEAAKRTFTALFRESPPLTGSLAAEILPRVLDECAAQRKKRRFRKVVRRLQGNAAGAGETRNVTAPGWERETLLSYLERLAYPRRELLVLREIAGQSVDDIASIIRMAPAVVRRQLLAARQQMLAISKERDLNRQWPSQ